ncbi:MAG: hypothetical protein HW384_448 [Dehalococcoidia bacterium]|nr:hypothetical protein [Dehalococcoidia bacterium]
MQSSLIGKIEKARRYAQERDRVTFSHFTVNFRGDHDAYIVNYDSGQWRCTCNFFSQWGMCSHTMALERILDTMLPGESVMPVLNSPAQGKLIPE